MGKSEKSGFLKRLRSEKVGLNSRGLGSQGERFKFDGKGKMGPSML